MTSNQNNTKPVMSVFEAVKQTVTARQAAERYSIHVNRHGMVACPFHPDSNPSMKLDNRFHCFACQADGDAIDFVSRLYQLPGKAAAVKLADDFGIAYDINQMPDPKHQNRERTPECQEEDQFFKVLTQYFQKLRQWEVLFAPQSPAEEMHPLFIEALQRKSYVEDLLDSYLFGTSEERAALQKEHNQEVKVIEQRIRNYAQIPDR